jgi:hypothetical protein
MWPFKGAQTSPQEYERLCMAEYRCWNAGAFPYDLLRGCKRCITHHAVRGCSLPEHNGFVAIVHDAGLHVHRILMNGERTFTITESDEIAAGKFLLEKRAEIMQLRELYSELYYQPAPVQEAQPQATKEVQ